MQDLEHTAAPARPTPVADAPVTLDHPDRILSHPGLTTTEKREVLAAWASDARAVPDAPALRRIDGGSVVTLDAVLSALRRLDPSEGSASARPATGAPGRRRLTLPRLPIYLRRDDDDDDPPPSPAAAFPIDVAAARRRRWEPDDCFEPVAA